MKEDYITRKLVTRHSDVDGVTVNLEKRYNYYGDRGVVDAVIHNKNERALWVCEVKADSAVKEATGANEIIRQFNKHRQFFKKGVDSHYPVPPKRRNYKLIFAATDPCYQHIMDNRELYQNLASEDYVHLTILHPEESDSGKPFSEDPLRDGWYNQYEYAEYIESVEKPELKDEYQLEEVV